MRRRTIAIVGIVVAIVVVLSGLFVVGVFSLERPSSNTTLAPNFTLTDIYGQPITLSSYRNTSVVVLEFTSLSCSECQIVEQSLHSIYATYNASGTTPVKMISIFTEPQFGDTVPALKSYDQSHSITWITAQDTMTNQVANAYGVTDIPQVFVINKQGAAVYDVVGAQSTSQIQSSVSAALSGTAKPISLVTVGVFALAAIAGVSTFFSPCAFPMFPGYMSLFLGLNATTTGGSTSGTATYKGAVRRALSAGSVSALGMMIVFLIIGVALIVAASAISQYVPDLLFVVGGVLIALGALLLTNLQYWRIVTPLQRLWGRLRGATPSATAAPVVPTAGTSQGLYLKLFGYGMGYAAAAAGCVFPVILSAIVAGLALGLVGGLVNILIYSLTGACLMIGVTLMLALAGKRWVNQLKAYTPVIKKVSAAVLVVVGIYLIYFYYSAWIL